MGECISYSDLQQMVKELQRENERLTEENINLKDKYQIGITEDEMEEMYKNYYSDDNEVIHIAN